MRTGRLIFWVWLAGAAVSFSHFVFSWAQVIRFLKSCRPADSNVSIERLTAGRAPVSSWRAQHTLLLISVSATSPFCWQLHRPVIVLPEFSLSLNERQLRFIIQHELAHLNSSHPLQLFLQRVVGILFWFHPMLWWASQQSALAREFACDDAALDSPDDIGAYLRSLLSIVEGTRSEKNSPAPLAFGVGKGVVSKRAFRLVQIAQSGMPPNPRRSTTLLLSCGIVVATALVSLVWVPVNVLASPRARWSPWPTWSSALLHDFGVLARDFEVYYGAVEPYELLQSENRADSQTVER
jgi:beta-lactamase regulating signal transducer with metallopeptidase domain